jgi:hypothetical protein
VVQCGCARHGLGTQILVIRAALAVLKKHGHLLRENPPTHTARTADATVTVRLKCHLSLC